MRRSIGSGIEALEGTAEARTGSSAIAALAPDERAPVLEAVRALAYEGRVTLRYTCEIHVTEPMPAASQAR